MDLKSDDIFNIDLDPALLLSYELDKLNLDNIPNDIFEFSEETPKILENSVGENVFIIKNEEAETGYSPPKCSFKLLNTEEKSCLSDVKISSKNQFQEKDINGNKEHSSCENLNQLFDELELSDFDDNKEELFDCTNYKIELPDNEKAELSDPDNGEVDFTYSDNETNDECSKFKERAPVRSQSRAKKSRDKSNILNKSKSSDRSQFNPETLKFLSGSSQIKVNEPNTAELVTIFPSLISCTGSESTTSSIQDYFYGDSRAKVVSSPESGYESSSAQSGSSSPPLLPSSISYDLDFIPESVDEQNILEFLVENTTDSALTDNNHSSCKSNDKDAKGKIIDIINYLKDIPDELSKSFNEVSSTNNTQDYVPLINVHESNIKSSQVSSNPVSKNAEVPKKLVYKLNDKAKNKLRTFLSVDEFYAAKARIYNNLRKATNCKDEKVIYVEDGTDKASENRTNLHHAVLDSRIEDIYCLVEIQKQYNKPLADINLRDKYGKTALDYAIQNQMALVVDYLKENCACQSVII